MAQKNKTRFGTGIVVLFAVCLGHALAETPTTTNQSGSGAMLPDAPSAVVTELQFSSFIPPSMNMAAGAEPAVLVFESSYRPDTARVRTDERLHRFLQNSFSPSASRGNLLDAVQAHFQKAWPGYGTGISGFERRYFAISAGHVANNFFGTYLFPTWLHQNPLSSRLGPGASLWRRFGYAITRVAVTRDDRGNETFNSSLLLSTVASNSVRNLYYPQDQRGLSSTIGGIEGSLIGNVQGNLSREFMPDIQQFLWKHAPAKLQRLAHHLPFSTKW